MTSTIPNLSAEERNQEQCYHLGPGQDVTRRTVVQRDDDVLSPTQVQEHWKQVQQSLAKLLSQNHYHQTKEWQYKNIAPRIIVEKLLQTKEGSIPNDYKLHCFNGKLAFTQVDIDRFTDHKRNLYNPDWSFLDCQWKYPNGHPVDKPEKYAEMKSLAERLAANFPYVRVDLYILGEQIFFGELTFHPLSGFGRFYPIDWDLRFGEALDIGT